MRAILRVLPCLAAASSLAGCAEDPNALTRRGPGSDQSSALECTEAEPERSYELFDGTKLEASRADENVGVNRARVKPFAALEKEFQRVLGVAPASIKSAGGSFESPPARWFGETEYSGVSLHAMASLSFDACLAYTKTGTAFGSAPTEDTARGECTKLMRKAWSRSPSPDEIAACAELATDDLASEKDVRRRWAYVCASVLSSSQFLTF